VRQIDIKYEIKIETDEDGAMIETNTGKIIGIEFLGESTKSKRGFISLGKIESALVYPTFIHIKRTIPINHEIIGFRCDRENAPWKINGLRELSFVLWAHPDREITREETIII